MKLAVSKFYEVMIWGERKDAPLFHVGVQTFSEDEAKTEALGQYRAHGFVNKIERIEVLSDLHIKPERKQQSLFEDFADLSLGYDIADIQGAAINLAITGVQRAHVKLEVALARWDELMGRGREALLRRYVGETDHRDENVVASEIGKRMIG